MGNTPTKDSQQEMYASYIQKQQDLIFKQQQQINELYKYNLETQQITPNMFFQQGIANQNYENGRRILGNSLESNEQFQQGNLPQGNLPQGNLPQNSLPQLPPANKQKLDPYKILNISKNYDEKTLKKAYLKAALVSHPDRGGTQEKFQLVSIAYTLLTKKLKEKDNSHSHNDLRNMSREYTQQQSNNPMLNTKMTDNFDIDVFNRIYEENKIPDAFDDGYGSWVNKNSELEQKKLFQNGFNKDLFNSTFEQYKKDQVKKSGSEMVKYKEPDVRISMKNQDSLMTLGQGKITDFGGTTEKLTFTDYKQAFTDGSLLIDTSSVDISDRSDSIDKIKSQRSKISYSLTPEDEKLVSLQKIEEQKAEENRLKRLKLYDEQHSQAFNKINSMMLK